MSSDLTLRAGAAAFVLAVVSSVHAQTTINFDALDAGAQLSNQFASSGVVFDGHFTVGNPTYMNDVIIPSAPNYIYLSRDNYGATVNFRVNSVGAVTDKFTFQLPGLKSGTGCYAGASVTVFDTQGHTIATDTIPAVGPNAGRDITTFAGNYPGTNAAQFLYVANPNCPNGIFPLDTLVFDAPVADPTPRLAIGFSWTAIQLGGTTNLIFGVSEPSTTATATGVAFSDVLPEGVVVATPNSVTGSCGGGTITAVAGSNSVSLSGARLAPSSTCIFSVAVVGNTVGIKTNTTSAVSSIESGAGGSAKATLYVAPPPTITMSFADPVVYYMVGTSNTTTLTFTLGNPVGNPLLMTSFAFTDTLPPGLFVSTPSVVTGNCEGNVTAVAGSNIISFFGGVSQPSCTISVKVTSRAVGPLTNTTSTITAVPFVPLVNYAAPFAGTPATATVFSSGMYSFWQ